MQYLREIETLGLCVRARTLFMTYIELCMKAVALFLIGLGLYMRTVEDYFCKNGTVMRTFELYMKGKELHLRVVGFVKLKKIFFF